MVACNDWEIESFDFNGAYLNGTLNKNKEIYMCPLPGYEINYRDIVLKLLKSLYGLKQAGCRWYKVLCHVLLDIGFNLSNYDPRIFYARVGNEVLILVVHVDNCILTGSSVELIKNCKVLLNSHYPLTDLGPIHWVLGIKITKDCDEWTISLLQSLYIESILWHFNLEDAKPHGSPMTPGTTLTRADVLSNAPEAKAVVLDWAWWFLLPCSSGQLCILYTGDQVH